MYLLDTNVLSELRRPQRADANVRAWASSKPAVLCHVSANTILEIEYGILLVARRDEAQAAVLRTWFDGEIMRQFFGRILAIDAEVARQCAKLHVPDRRPERDALIAATALTHAMTLVTRNVADFQSMGVTMINPWLSQQSD